MKVINTIVVTLLPLAALAHAQLAEHQLPLDENNIIRQNGTVSASTDEETHDISNDNAAFSASIPFAKAFLARSHAPPDTSIESFHWAGTGCATPESLYAEFNDKAPLGSAAAFSYFTPRFVLSAGVNDASPSESRKQCTVTFRIKYPKGWKYSLGGAESKGYAGFSAGGGALVEGSYWFAGVSGTERWSSTVAPPLHEEWMLGYKPNDASKGLWSRCGENDMLSMQMSVYVPPSSHAGVFLLEWTNLYMRWQECSVDGDNDDDNDKKEL